LQVKIFFESAPNHGEKVCNLLKPFSSEKDVPQ
jgi:hypothetical protein